MLAWLTRSIAPTARLRNEMAQLQSIRDDAGRVRRDGVMWHWLGGAIFALSWIVGEKGAIEPSRVAHETITTNPNMGHL